MLTLHTYKPSLQSEGHSLDGTGFNWDETHFQSFTIQKAPVCLWQKMSFKANVPGRSRVVTLVPCNNVWVLFMYVPQQPTLGQCRQLEETSCQGTASRRILFFLAVDKTKPKSKLVVFTGFTCVSSVSCVSRGQRCQGFSSCKHRVPSAPWTMKDCTNVQWIIFVTRR